MCAPKIIDRREPGSPVVADLANFAETCAGSLVRWERHVGAWGTCDVMIYSPPRNEILISQRPAWRGYLESVTWRSLHEVRGLAWIPRERRFAAGRHKDLFCYLLGSDLACGHRGPGVPDYILLSPEYLAGAERLIREFSGRLRYRLIGWLGIDPLALSVEGQALVTESALKYA